MSVFFCKNRIDKVLYKSQSYYGYSSAECEAENLAEKYGDKIKDRTKLEDEIVDMQLVDRSFLEMYEQTQKDVHQQIQQQKETADCLMTSSGIYMLPPKRKIKTL